MDIVFKNGKKHSTKAFNKKINAIRKDGWK